MILTCERIIGLCSWLMVVRLVMLGGWPHERTGANARVFVRPSHGKAVPSRRAASDTHPGLLEAVGPSAIVRVVRDGLGLLELLPQLLYPVVVTGSQSATGNRQNREERDKLV